MLGLFQLRAAWGKRLFGITGLALVVLSHTASAGGLSTFISWTCGLLTTSQSRYVYTQDDPNIYSPQDFSVLSLHGDYHRIGSTYVSIQSALANLVAQSYRDGLSPQDILDSVAEQMALVVNEFGQREVYSERHFAEKRTFELETTLWRAPAELRTLSVSPELKVELVDRFAAEFAHVEQRTGIQPRVNARAWADSMVAYQKFWHQSLDHDSRIVAVSYRIVLSQHKDILFTLHAQPERIEPIMEDLFLRLSNVRYRSGEKKEMREFLFNAYWSFLMVAPYAEGNTEIAAPYFAGIFLAVTGEKLKVTLPIYQMIKSSRISRKEFIERMETEFQHNLLKAKGRVSRRASR